MKAIRVAIARRRPRVSNCGETSSLRAYTPSDSAAAIDWRASARGGDLTVRERSRAVAISWTAIIDESPSMRTGTQLSEAEEAAAVWRQCGASSDAWLGIRHSSDTLYRTLDWALRVLPAHCALLYISDFYDLPATPDSVLQLCAKRFDCTALVVCDVSVDEIVGLARLADAETGKTFPARLGAAQRLRYAAAANVREETAVAQLQKCGWRAARLQRGYAPGALMRAFESA